MTNRVETAAGTFENLERKSPDPLLSMIAQFRDDRRSNKIDLAVGVYRDQFGTTPVMTAVKKAEQRLLQSQTTKSYLGLEGDVEFAQLLKNAVLGPGSGARAVGLQTPGATGALRLAAELIRQANPDAHVLIGLPTWVNHQPVMLAAGLQAETYQQFDVAGQRILFDQMMGALARCKAGDAMLLHGCCQNPTGQDLSADQWSELAHELSRRGVLPLIDLSYHGLGDGLEADVAGIRTVFSHVDEGLVVYSCAKNFGLYRDRAGALLGVTSNRDTADRLYSNMLALTRVNWSMPPDHGAAVARTILESDELTKDWEAELAAMRDRIRQNRLRLASGDPTLAPLRDQRGMFSMLPLDAEIVRKLNADYAIYLAGPGRINVTGFRSTDIENIERAFQLVRRK